MLYISDIYDVFTQEHFLSLRGHTLQQEKYCVELRDFITGKQAVLCRPKGALQKKYKNPFGVVNDGNLFVVDSKFRDLLSYIDVEVVPISERDRTKCVDYTKFYSIDTYGLFYERSISNIQELGSKMNFNLIELLVAVQSHYPDIKMYEADVKYIRLRNSCIKVTFDKDMTVPITRYKIRRGD